MKKNFIATIVLSTLLFSCGGEKKSTTAQVEEVETTVVEEVPEKIVGKVYFKNIQDGDTLTSPFYADFGLEGMVLNPAGELIPGTGHHHIIINEGFIAEGEVVPADATHFHYGKAQTGDTLNLPAGTHQVTLQLANGYHQSYGESLSNTITVTVVEE